jgi:hypothetical protein
MPNARSLRLLGDGAMQMMGINALTTLASMWRNWSDPRLVIMVLNNGDLNMVTWEQRITEGDAKLLRHKTCPPSLRRLRRAGPARHRWSTIRPGGRGMGAGAGLARADAAGNGHRPECAAAAAAYLGQTGRHTCARCCGDPDATATPLATIKEV